MTDEWRPIATAPENLTVLCRTGAVYYHAGCIKGVWYNDAGRVAHPEEWYYHVPTLADLIDVMRPA